MATRSTTALTLFALCAAACGGDSGSQQDAPAAASDSAAAAATESGGFDVELNLDTASMERSSTGLYTLVQSEGTGEVAEAGDSVWVHYTGWLTDGTEFDSSRDGQPLAFQLGTGSVIPGWDEGVAGMKVGEKRRLVIPPDLAYGPDGAAGGVIPPNATLVFDVELMQVSKAAPAR